MFVVLFVVLLLGWQAQFDITTLAVLAVYAAINLAVLPLVYRGSSMDGNPAIA